MVDNGFRVYIDAKTTVELNRDLVKFKWEKPMDPASPSIF
jgi:hypothetical protein